MADLDAPVLLGTIDNPRDAVGHNTYIRGNIAYQANYTSGLRLVDISDIANGIGTEIGYFDTYPEDDDDDGSDRASRSCAHSSNGGSCGVASFQGAWSDYPFFASDVVIVSDTERGLFVLRPN